MGVVKAIHAELASTAAITALLGTYDFGSGAAPAIFTFEPAPGDASNKLITIVGAATDAFGCRDKRGANPSFEVKVWDDKGRSKKSVRDLAILVWETLNRCTLSITGYEEVGAIAEYPIPVDDPEGFPGYRVSVEVIILEE